MISYSPTRLILLKNVKEVSILIEREVPIGAYRVELVKLDTNSKKGQQVKTETCKVLVLGNSTEKKFQIKLQQSDLQKDISSCKSAKDNLFAVSFIPLNAQKTEISLTERILVPIIDETQHSKLSDERNASTLLELQKIFTLEKVQCNKTLTFEKDDLLCQTTVLNNSESPVSLTFISTVRKNSFPATTVYQKIEQSDVTLYPEKPQSLQFTIPKDSYEMGNYQISANVSFSTFGTEAPSYITSQDTPFFYFPQATIIIAVFAILLISAILIRRIVHKFFAQKRGKQITKN